MKRQKICRTFAVIAAAALISAGAFSCSSVEMDMSMPADTYELERQNVENYISVSGNVEGSDIVKVTSELNTKVKTLNVEIGSSVNEGDVLCTFDSSDLQTEYNNLKESYDKSGERTQSVHDINVRNLNNARSDKNNALNQARKAIDRAVDAQNRAYDKYNDTVRKRDDYYNKREEAYAAATNEEEPDEAAYQDYLEYDQLYQAADAEAAALDEQLGSYDAAVTDAWDAYYAAERSADLAIQSAQDIINNEKFETDNSVESQLEKLQERIDKCTVKAPRSGIITALNISEGSIPTTDSIMTIEDTSKLRINVKINEADILNVHEGQKTVITTTATGDKEFSGTVSRVVNIMSGQTSNAFTGETSGGGYSAEITIDAQENNLLIGMNAKVKIILDEKTDVLAVPYDAVVESEDGEYSVFVAEGSEGNYTAKEVSVTKGMETNYLTEISSSELKEGDLIIINPDSVNAGEPVNISGSYYDSLGDGE